MDNYNEGAIDNQINIIKNLVNGLRTTMNKFIFSKERGDEITNYVNTISNNLDSMKNIVKKENYTESKPAEQSPKQCNKKSDYNVVLNPAVEAELKAMEDNNRKTACLDYTRFEILAKIKNVFKDPYMIVQLKKYRNGYLARIFNRFTNRMIFNFAIFFDTDLEDCINSAYDIYDKVFRDGVEAQDSIKCKQPTATEQTFHNGSIKRPRNSVAETESEESSEDNTTRRFGKKDLDKNQTFADTFIKTLKEYLSNNDQSTSESNDEDYDNDNDNDNDESESEDNNVNNNSDDDVTVKIKSTADLIRVLSALTKNLK